MFDLIFADVGEGIHEGKVIQIHFKKGDKVTEGDVLVTVETDKVNADLPAPKTGTIYELNVKENDIIHVGHKIASIITDEEENNTKTNENYNDYKKEDISVPKDDDAGVVGSLSSCSDTIPFSEEKYEIEEEEETEIKKEFSSAKSLATPIVRAMAKKMGIDLKKVKGTGINGKILKTDLEKIQTELQKHTQESSKSSIDNNNVSQFIQEKDQEITPISSLRKAILQQMVISKNNTVSVTLMDEVNINDLVNFRKKSKTKLDAKGIKLTYMAFIMRAVVMALKDFPIFNSTFDHHKNELIIKKYVNLGIAVDTKDGLVVPNIKNAHELNIIQLAETLQQIASNTLERKISLNQLKNGTFTISNFGSIDVIYATPIINYPELAILGVGKIIQKPIVEQNQIISAHMLPLSLTLDHRMIDGGDGGRFLKRIKEILNNPYSYLLLSSF